jgi:surface-anchored protein
MEDSPDDRPDDRANSSRKRNDMRHLRRPSLLAAGLLALLLAAPPLALATEDALDQRIDEDQEVATDEVARGQGHIDLGPRYVDAQWTLMVHDDTDVTGSMWRELDRTVFQVRDAALQQVPDDPAYEFLGVPAGESVHVVPQTQDQDVIWLGWNTQDPEVMRTVDRGVTLSLTAVDGPGDLLVYLQDGGFGEPDVLWDSRLAEAQPLWVDVNTHTHANWVFTEPGVYSVAVEARADRVDGTEVSDTGVLRLAVGDGTPTDAALTAALDEAAPQEEEPAASADTEDDPTATDDGSGALVVGLAGGAALVLVLALVLLSVRGRGARRRALEETS